MKILKNNLLLFFSVISFLGFSQTYVYQEEFNSTNGWLTGNNDTRELSVYNGRYYFEHKRTTDSWRVTSSEFTLSNSDDFEIETSIQKISGVQDYGISLLYDFKDEKNYKEFGITANGYYRVAENVDDNYSTLQAWTTSSYLKTGNYGSNDLKITKKGSTITFYINNNYVYSTTHKSIVGKKMGIQLYRNQKISIDYLRVTKTSSTINNNTSGETILFDGFNDNNNNWATQNNSDVTLEIKNGGYDFDHKRDNGGWNTTYEKKIDTNRDFYIEGSFLKMTGVQDRGFGLIFGRKDNDNQNEFFISGNGMYYIQQTSNGTSTAVKGWTSASQIKTGNNQYNYLKIEKKGNALNYYINSTLVHTQYSPTFYGDRTGFIVYGRQKISITYLSMRYIGTNNNYNNNNNNNFNNNIGESILFDDFTSNGNNWSDRKDDTANFYISNGKYYLDHTRDEKGWLSHISREFDSTKDFEIETKFQHVSGDTNSPYGILWGKKDTNYFQFLITATGYYKVNRVINNQSEDIIKWTKTTYLKEGVGGENTIKITREGDYYKFYINNTYITRIDFENFYGSEIGYSIYYRQKIAIDYLSIKGLKENIDNVIVTNDALKIPLYDDFSSNKNNWNLENADDYSLDLTGGKLIMHRKKEGGIFISRDVDIDDTKDFIIETSIGEINTSTGWYGVTFGRKNSSNEFSFLLSGNGNYKFRKFDNDAYKEIIPLTFASSIKTGSNAENVIKIVKSGSLIRFYINNTYVNEAPFQRFFGNKFGYTIYHDRKIDADYLDIKYQTESYNNPPVIVITDPVVEEVRGFKIVEANTITVRGKASDTDGIFSITVNGKEATVSENGTFVANVPLGYGKNDLIVKATDLKQASSTKSFVIKRNSPEVDNNKNVTINDTKETLDIGFGKYYALIIGVSDYEDESIQDLNGEPTKDAQALADVLVNNYSFDRQNVTVLKNPKANDIIKQFSILKNKITKNDNLVIFYAGHGNYDQVSEKGYWMPSDAQMEFELNVILNTSIVTLIKAINSRHTLLIADACFSGSILVKNRDFKTATKAVQKKYELPSRKAITSGTLTTVPNQSVFMKYLLNRLRDNSEKYISAGQLFNLIEDAVINNTTGDNQPQYAPIGNTGDEGGDFIFIKK
ncbi:hypothetical protein [Polaribacter sp.]|uniref:hypothetical protein n=1 Tax=Polaribacter sp. TaxID=1920175 RepID=UPI0040471E6C